LVFGKKGKRLIKTMTNTHTYLLEVGCEELPAGFLTQAVAQWPPLLQEALAAHQISLPSATDIRVEATPRRLVCWISGLPQQLPDRVHEIKGPPVRIAYDANDTPSPATQGFLKKNQATIDQVAEATVGEETYLVLRQTIAGQTVPEVIGAVALEAFGKLAGPRFMRWGDHSVTFSRSVSWLLSMWDDQPCPASLDLGDGQHLTSGQITYGHRVMGPGTPITINSAASYETQLADTGNVVVSIAKRQALIEAQLQAAAQQLGAQPVLDDELLDHVTHLVEAPTVVVGSFASEYLAVPTCVLVTVMKAHQKYFPVTQADGQLMPHFLCVSNGRPEASATIAKGNQRVLKARLDDALFFWEQDRKIPLDDRLEALKGVTFQKGLGSLFDKTERLEGLAARIAESVDATDTVLIQQVRRAARLSKADLVTSLVFEFTELQGEIGERIAIAQGEDPAVAKALFEQYLPRFAGDDLPQTPVGKILSLAEKADTLVAVFSQKDAKLPSGSKDPLGLRRTMNGIIGTILTDFKLSKTDYFHLAYEALSQRQLTQRPWEAVLELLQEFAVQRLTSVWREQGHRSDCIKTALEGSDCALQDLQTVVQRLDKLKETPIETLLPLIECANRVDRILGKKAMLDAQWGHSIQHLKSALLRENEQALCQLLKGLSTNAVGSSALPLQEVMAFTPVVAQYFNEVLVNNPEDSAETLAERMKLLNGLHNLYCQQVGRLRLLDTTALQQQAVASGTTAG
jgi:glycyl-tRNA synthetase beta chain